MYVSSDQDQGAVGTSLIEHGWDFAVPFADAALRSKLKARYEVWAMMEAKEFGQVRVRAWLGEMGEWMAVVGGGGLRGGV